MGMANQGMKLPTTGTTTTPNGRTFNTNPAANQMMADRARMAREQRTQPSPQGGANMVQSNQEPRLTQAAQAANQAAMQAQMQAAQGNTGGLPAGLDPRAVAANPQGYQQWLAGAKAQEAARPGSTMLGSQQTMPYNMPPQAAQGGMGGKGGQPPSPQQLSQGLERQIAMNRAMGKGSQPPAPQNFGGNNQFGEQRGRFNNFNNRFDNYGGGRGGGRGNFGGGYGGGMGQRGFRR